MIMIQNIFYLWLFYSLICISFFADQEIDDSEKSAIFNAFKRFTTDLDENEFNSKDNYYKNEYNVKIESLRKKSKTLGEILLVNQTRHSTVQSVIHLLNIVKDHYVFES